MSETESVSKLMNALLEQPLAIVLGMGIKTVKLISQSEAGNHGGWSAQLGLSEYEGEYGDEQVDTGQA